MARRRDRSGRGSRGTRSRSGQLGDASDCTPGATRAPFASFVAGFNRGDLARLDGLFAEPSRFVWYSSNVPGRRLGRAASDRGTLIGYFRARHRKHDRLRLVTFTSNGNSGGYGHFAVRLKRSTADYRGASWFGLVGKGAAVCSEQSVQLVVVSLGAPGSDRA